MKNILKISQNKLIKIVTLTLIGAIIFTFLHSELGFLDFDSNNHGSHDYCEIVKNINTHTKTLRDEIPTLKITNILFNHFLHSEESLISNVVYNRVDRHTIVKQSTGIYLFNSTFLI